jgi:hypothetical protein
VNHKPKPVVFVCLDFNEVVSAAECCKLDSTFVPADGLKARIAERDASYVLGLLNDLPPVSAASWYCPTKFCQYVPGDPWITQRCSINVQGYRQHATSDVASNCLWIDKMRRGNDNSYANVGRKMHVGHYSNLLNVW